MCFTTNERGPYPFSLHLRLVTPVVASLGLHSTVHDVPDERFDEGAVPVRGPTVRWLGHLVRVSVAPISHRREIGPLL